ncbi:MAG: CvpA family protein [Candidatus Electrothrix sp. AR3]|nr:CvpA family protein [Candidatus Electrothrix sp. AR3]
MAFNEITSYDYIIVLFLLIFLVRGLCVGFVRQLATSFALVGSYWLAGQYVGQVIPFVQQVITQPKMVFLASFLALFVFFAMLFILVGRLLHKVMEVSLLGWFNRFLGGILGLAKGTLVVVVVHMVLASIFPPSYHLLRNSQTAPYLVLGGKVIRQFIEDVRVKEDLLPLEDEEVEEEQPVQEQAAPAPPVLQEPLVPPAAEGGENIEHPEQSTEIR